VSTISTAVEIPGRRYRDVPFRTPAGLAASAPASRSARSAPRRIEIRKEQAPHDKPTVHAIAHSVARILEQDHLRIAEQLQQAGINLNEARVRA
jgi:hypothetical protein